MFQRVTLMLAVAALCLTPACGRQVGLAADPGFLALDSNGDGVISQAESHMALLAFNAADRNGDGSLDILEWAATGDNSDNVGRQQRAAEDRREVLDPHRTGNTMRGAN